MLLGLGYLYVCYVPIFLLQKAENNRLKKPVGEDFVIYNFFVFA